MLPTATRVFPCIFPAEFEFGLVSNCYLERSNPLHFHIGYQKERGKEDNPNYALPGQ
jgi:hypothetical protein